MIRRAVPADIAAVARLHREVRLACLPYLPDLHPPASVLAFFRDRVFPSSAVWVTGKGSVDGFCAFREGWIDHLYIRPDCHGRGLGTALLRQALAGQSHAQLWVFQRNSNAIRFYRARGFRLVQETDGSGNEEREPDALMEWTV